MIPYQYMTPNLKAFQEAIKERDTFFSISDSRSLFFYLHDLMIKHGVSAYDIKEAFDLPYFIVTQIQNFDSIPHHAINNFHNYYRSIAKPPQKETPTENDSSQKTTSQEDGEEREPED